MQELDKYFRMEKYFGDREEKRGRRGRKNRESEREKRMRE